MAQSPRYPLLNLDPRDFEELAALLLRAEANGGEAAHDRVVLLAEGRDKGRDVLLFARHEVVGVVQCKRHKNPITAGAFLTQLLRFALFAVRDPAVRPKAGAEYKLWTASGVTADLQGILDACDTTALRQELPAYAASAREGVRSLSPSGDSKDVQREVDEAVELAIGLRLSHVGPTEIALRLSGSPDVRRLFFRSPDDLTPSVGEIDPLVSRRRGHQLVQLRDGGRLGTPFMDRVALDEAFTEFLDDPSRAFVLLGGSGQGKTSWAAHLFERPPAGYTCDLIAAEEIAPYDRSIVDTFARLIAAGPLGGVPPERVEQAVWTWLDADNRILVVDGLDRIRSDVSPGLPQWVASALNLSRDTSVRVVLTSRREAWALIATNPGLHHQGIFHEDGVEPTGPRQPSLELLELSVAEADRLYDIYGVMPSAHGVRALATPALIATFARLSRAGAATGPTNRLDVLEADLASMQGELGNEASIGPVSAKVALIRLGRLLLDGTGGWFPGVQAGGPDPVALDHLVRRDRLLLEEDRLRVVSDDLAELLMARQLTADRILSELGARRKDALFIGAVALFVASQEAAGTAHEVISRVLAAASPGVTSHLDALARAILELRSPESVIPTIQSIVALWNLPNSMLFGSNLGEMIDRVQLPATERFRLAMPLMGQEDPIDWRDKYWDPTPPPGRHVTPFAAAVVRAVREDAERLLPELMDMLESGDELEVAVGRGLLREAGMAAPDQVLGYTWTRRALREEPFRLVALQIPGSAAAFLSKQTTADDDHLDEIVGLVEDIADRVSGRKKLSSASSAVGEAALSLASRPMAPQFFVRLAIVGLRYLQDEGLRSGLLSNWEAVDDSHFWAAVGAIGREGRGKVLDLLDGHAGDRDVGRILGWIGGFPGEIADDPVIHEALRRYSERGEEEAAAAAGGVELLLYRLPAPSSEVIERLADALSQSPSARARSVLTYYAGSPAGTGRGGAEIARRDRMLDLIVDNAQPDDAHQLIWKLIESGAERPGNGLRLCRLANRCGLPSIQEATAVYAKLYPDRADIIAAGLQILSAVPIASEEGGIVVALLRLLRRH